MKPKRKSEIYAHKIVVVVTLLMVTKNRRKKKQKFKEQKKRRKSKKKRSNSNTTPIDRKIIFFLLFRVTNPMCNWHYRSFFLTNLIKTLFDHVNVKRLNFFSFVHSFACSHSLTSLLRLLCSVMHIHTHTYNTFMPLPTSIYAVASSSHACVCVCYFVSRLYPIHACILVVCIVYDGTVVMKRKNHELTHTYMHTDAFPLFLCLSSKHLSMNGALYIDCVMYK